ncbi:MAG: cytochrome o ubiquinol oxidase subunit IV [Candidatus Microsaccharimonas sp.]
MKKPTLATRDSQVPYISYVVGFILSVITTFIAYLFVVNDLWPSEILVPIVLGIAVVQLIVQMVFFLHIGRGSRWKGLTFIFTAVIILIVVGGTVWVMANLNYNMMDMSPDEQHKYMSEHEGI